MRRKLRWPGLIWSVALIREGGPNLGVWKAGILWLPFRVPPRYCTTRALAYKKARHAAPVLQNHSENKAADKGPPRYSFVLLSVLIPASLECLGKLDIQLPTLDCWISGLCVFYRGHAHPELRSGLNLAYTTNFKLELFDVDTLAALIACVSDRLQVGRVDLEGRLYCSGIADGLQAQGWQLAAVQLPFGPNLKCSDRATLCQKALATKRKLVEWTLILETSLFPCRLILRSSKILGWAGLWIFLGHTSNWLSTQNQDCLILSDTFTRESGSFLGATFFLLELLQQFITSTGFPDRYTTLWYSQYIHKKT